MRAGGGKIGKVEVDCRFIFTKSHWGVLGTSEHPAGIIYLDLDFRPPPDCRLESATVSVTLTADGGEENNIEVRSACPVKFTDHYGPKSIRGQETLVQTKKVKNRTPHVELFGYGAGGLGVNKEKIVQTTIRWKFAGHIASSKGSIWYDTLRWELQENTLERQPTHSNLIHTAFALEHNATRFYMTVHVSGKLAKFSDKIKSRLKFGGKEGKEGKNQEIVTKIEWEKGYSCPLRLDQMAHDLHFAMELENMSKIPIEIPSAMPATFRPAAMGPASIATAAQEGRADPRPVQHSSARPRLESGPPTGAEGLPWRMENSTQHFSVPTLEDLSMAAGLARPRPPLAESRREIDQGSEYSGSTTLVNPEEFVQENRASLAGKAVPKNQITGIRADAGAMLLLHWLRSIGLQFLLLMAGIFPVSTEMNPPRLETVAGKVKIGDSERLRLVVPQKEPQRDYDDETLVASSGLTPSSMAQTPSGILKRGLRKTEVADAERYPVRALRRSRVGL
jgi:hypothetical protein